MTRRASFTRFFVFQCNLDQSMIGLHSFQLHAIFIDSLSGYILRRSAAKSSYEVAIFDTPSACGGVIHCRHFHTVAMKHKHVTSCDFNRPGIHLSTYSTGLLKHHSRNSPRSPNNGYNIQKFLLSHIIE